MLQGLLQNTVKKVTKVSDTTGFYVNVSFKI